jgi:hypothetical protein
MNIYTVKDPSLIPYKMFYNSEETHFYFGDYDFTQVRETGMTTHNSFEAALLHKMPLRFNGRVIVQNLDTKQIKFFKVEPSEFKYFEASIREIEPGTKEYYD